jgi:dihydrolipoamide dehydrogenase
LSKSFDIAVLGGGPGGYVAAIRAAHLGFKTVVIEKDNLGGICLNWGCIPTKSLLKNAEVYDLIKNHAGEFGISVEGVNFDFGKIIKRSRDIADKISKNVELLLKKNKIEHLRGFGKLVSNNKIDVFDNEGNLIESVNTKNIIISTGAKPKSIPSIPVDKKSIITSSEAMNLSAIPKDLIVIGAGAIGIEFAYFYNIFGTKVTIIELMDHILPVEDKEISEALLKSFKKRGINIYTSAKVENAIVKENSVEVFINQEGKSIKLNAEKVLSAIGVEGNISDIGLENIGVIIEKGHIKVDRKNYATNIAGVYAIGDVIGAPWLAHVASAEGIHCIESIKGMNPTPINYNNIPGCTYCIPQVASVGMTESQARENGYELKIGKFPFMASGKAFATGDREGFVKLIFDAKYGELLGGHIIGPEATELISEITLAKSMEATYESIIKTIHAHPTLSESTMEAAANAYGESIHI